MPETDLKQILALFEQCLELEPDERLRLVHERCADKPDQLAALLDLIERDEALDQARHQSEAGLGALSRVALSERFYQGQIVGAFRIEECIGSGGMGTVYRVCRIDGQVEQQAALKLLSPGHVRQTLLSRFSNERRLLASLEHPGICRFLDAGTLEDDQPYVLMELIEGQPFLESCDQAHLGLRQRVELFLKVVEAVAHAHRRLVIHRDIKSGNILVNRDGRPKLLDFGIAKSLAVEASWEQTQTIERFLTPRSAAPEQLLGQPVGVACDIYALGQLLYELLCGQPPFAFAGMRPSEVERLIVSQPPPPMAQRSQANDTGELESRGCRSHAELKRQLRGDLETIVLKCLRKKPENRYPSVEQLEADLKRWLTNRPIRLRKNERSYRLRKFITRNQVAVSLSGLLVVTLLISGAGLVWQSINMAKERNRALLERDRAQHTVSILQQAFESADPAGVLGADVKARDILQSARAPVLALRESQPGLFVSLAAVLASVESELRMTESAAELAQSALGVAEDVGAEPLVIRNLLMVLADALTNSRARAEAEDVFGQIVALDERPRPDLLHVQGRWHLLGNERARAIELFEQALELHIQDGTPLEERVEHSLDLATALSQSGMHEKSLSLYAGLLRELESSYGSDHALMTRSRLSWIEALIRADLLGEAIAEAKGVGELIMHQYGARSAWAGRFHTMHGMLFLRQGDPLSAADSYRQALDIWREHFSQDHPDILRVTINLAYALQHSDGGMSQAEAVYREALESLIMHSGINNRTAIIVRGLMSQLLIAQGRTTDAVQELLGFGEVDEHLAVQVPHWRQGFAEALGVGSCGDFNLSRGLDMRCEWVAARIQE